MGAKSAQVLNWNIAISHSTIWLKGKHPFSINISGTIIPISNSFQTIFAFLGTFNRHIPLLHGLGRV
jgi:hypothetical protein